LFGGHGGDDAQGLGHGVILTFEYLSQMFCPTVGSHRV
jgi:hypothetical protein